MRLQKILMITWEKSTRNQLKQANKKYKSDISSIKSHTHASEKHSAFSATYPPITILLCQFYSSSCGKHGLKIFVHSNSSAVPILQQVTTLLGPSLENIRDQADYVHLPVGGLRSNTLVNKFIGMSYKGKWNSTCFPMTWATQMLLLQQFGTWLMTKFNFVFL